MNIGLMIRRKIKVFLFSLHWLCRNALLAANHNIAVRHMAIIPLASPEIKLKCCCADNFVLRV